jgi:hypothetical protein
MGRDALPLILERLDDRPARWFWALRAIAREDPAEGIEAVEGAVDAWREWGHERGYVG